jgi:hypothetical protein
LESITDPSNTILEFPVSQLFEKYWNRPHPLAVRWVKRNFKSLLWKDWIENLSEKVPQKLSHRAEKVTSDTQYEAWDTLRFKLINPLLEWVFPKYLTDQLKESWFKWYSDPNSATLSKRISNKKEWKISNNGDFIYDVVVKKVEWWKSALALYRDWELFMTCYVSAWLKGRKTKRGQFKIVLKNPYYFSRKYKSPMPECLIFDEWWFWLHQWDVTWYFLSHWCVRQPWMNAMVLYSCLENSNNADIFIDDNLYK